MEKEVWYRVEYTVKGEGDWFATGNSTFDSEKAARQWMDEVAPHPKFDYRVVKVTTITEPLSGGWPYSK
jgi:hypothetical protein